MDRVHMASQSSFVGRFEVAEPAHEFLVLEVDVIEVEREVAFGKGLEVAQATRDHGDRSHCMR